MKKLAWLSSLVFLVVLVVLLLGDELRAADKQTGTKQLTESAVKVYQLPTIERGGAVYPAKDMIQQEILWPPRPVKKTYSILANEFDSYHQKITWASEGGSVNRYVSSCGIAVCGLEAPIHLPDWSRIIGYSCKVMDNSSTHPVHIDIVWSKGDGFAYSISSCSSATAAAGYSPGIQTITNDACSVAVDNATWAYAIRFFTYEGGTGATTCEDGGKTCRIYNCFVYYY